MYICCTFFFLVLFNGFYLQINTLTHLFISHNLYNWHTDNNETTTTYRSFARNLAVSSADPDQKVSSKLGRPWSVLFLLRFGQCTPRLTISVLKNLLNLYILLSLYIYWLYRYLLIYSWLKVIRWKVSEFRFLQAGNFICLVNATFYWQIVYQNNICIGWEIKG